VGRKRRVAAWAGFISLLVCAESPPMRSNLRTAAKL